MVDFNPFSPMTDSLLFSWDELSSSSTAVNGEGGAPVISPVIRVFEGASSIRPHDLHTSRLPQVTRKDEIEICSVHHIHVLIMFQFHVHVMIRFQFHGVYILQCDVVFVDVQDIVDLASGEEIHKFVDFYKSV